MLLSLLSLLPLSSVSGRLVMTPSRRAAERSPRFSRRPSPIIAIRQMIDVILAMIIMIIMMAIMIAPPPARHQEQAVMQERAGRGARASRKRRRSEQEEAPEQAGRVNVSLPVLATPAMSRLCTSSSRSLPEGTCEGEALVDLQWDSGAYRRRSAGG